MSPPSMVSWPCTVDEAIDTFFSHNELIALWILMTDESGNSYHYKIYYGEAWRLPTHYRNTLMCTKFFGTIPETVDKGDTINIEISPIDINGNRIISIYNIEPTSCNNEEIMGESE